MMEFERIKVDIKLRTKMVKWWYTEKKELN